MKAAITDHDRYNFMSKLSDAVRTPNGIIITPWEDRFLTSWRQSSSPTGWFIGERRLWTDRLRMKYGSMPEVNMPHPDDLVAESPKIAEADPTGCQYLVKGDDGRQVRCNEPATCCDPGRLRYCEMHAEAAIKAMKRQGVTLRLIRNFQ